MRDTVESLRPQLEFFKTPQEAYEAALELERKYRDKIGKWVWLREAVGPVSIGTR